LSQRRFIIMPAQSFNTADTAARENKCPDEQLKSSLNEIRDLKNALNEHAIVAITDPEGKITYVNDKFCAISKYSREELVGRDHRILNSGFHSNEFICNLWTTIGAGKVWKGEIKNQAKDGSFFWVDTTIVPFLNEDGKTYQYVAIRADITERKQLLLKERQSNDALEAANKEFAYQVKEKGKRADELAAIVEERTLANKELAFQVAEKGKRADELAVIVEERTAADVELAFQVAEKGKRADELVLINAELKQSNEALERSNVELAQFAYIASHDLQTPLRNISGFVQLIKLNYADKLDERGRDWIRRAVQSAEQMHTLIRDVLEYSRVDSRARPFELVSLREVFNDAVGLLEASIRDAGGEVTRGELPTVIGDRSQLVQLLQNLIGNGLKYRSEKTPHVHVSAQCGGHEWTISISDNGMGIAPRHYERIFEIFKRLHNQQEYPGTGIGLAVCRRVVNRHAGKIWVESRSDQGSTFNFTIPERMIAKL
jgi:PAS domain S-box-containing protein